MTAPNWQGISAAGSETSVPWPASHASGDLAILDVEHGDGTIATPTDFTIHQGATHAFLTINGQRSGFYRRATSAAEANAALSGSSDHAWGVITTVRNAHQVYPIHAYSTTAGNSSGAPGFRFPSLKTLVDYCLIHYAVTSSLDATSISLASPTSASLTNVTLRSDTGTTSGNGGVIATVSGEMGTAGHVATGAFTSSVNFFGVVATAIAPIADIQISGTVSHSGTAVTGGSVRLIDVTQPAATYLVLNASELDAAATPSAGAWSMFVPYTDHEYIAIYTDTSGLVYGSSQLLTYASGAFPSAVIQIEGTVAFPAITGATTPANIRDRIIALITAVTPTSLAGDKFRVSRDESDADFRKACESAPTSCLRRYQVRSIGKRGTPAVSNVDSARHTAVMQIVIAYPNSNRYGGNAGRSRDDVIDEDLLSLDWACGVFGRGNFTVATSSDCTPFGFDEDPPLETEGTVSFLVITARYEYALSVVPA